MSEDPKQLTEEWSKRTRNDIIAEANDRIDQLKKTLNQVRENRDRHLRKIEHIQKVITYMGKAEGFAAYTKYGEEPQEPKGRTQRTLRALAEATIEWIS